jgi:dipeptidyl aminopeptidase/acylaminoacyl peptidase
MRVMSPCLIAFLALSAPAATGAENARAIEPRDCVTVRSLSGTDTHHSAIQINPQGTMAAYLVNSPNLATNENDGRLSVVGLEKGAQYSPRVLLARPGISQIHWLRDGRHITAMVKENGYSAVESIDTTSGERRVLARSSKEILEYSANGDGSVLVFAAADIPLKEQPSLPVAARDSPSGYRVSYSAPTLAHYPQARLFLVGPAGREGRGQPKEIHPNAPSGFPRLVTVNYAVDLNLSVSPNGRLLSLTCLVGDKAPGIWGEALEKSHSITMTLLVDLKTGSVTIPFPSPFSYSVPLWSDDSRGYAVVAGAPLDSEWGRRTSMEIAGAIHLYWVDLSSQQWQEVSAHVANLAEQPLRLDRGDRLIVHSHADEVAVFSRAVDGWKKDSELRIPLDHPYRYSQIASDGKYVVGEYQSTGTPPEIFLYMPQSGARRILEKLNPQFDDLALAPMERISWTTSGGAPIDGILVKPPDYLAGRKYPLVIQTREEQGQFLCDAGGVYRYSSYEPQPVADAGMLYLVRSWPEDLTPRDNSAYFPQGYPEGIAEAEFNMDIWDSAVAALTERGRVDPERVGIIGFSRAGWYTEFSLAHARTHYAAATLTDNAQYSLAEYWLGRSENIMNETEAMYGGPPYGETLKNWMRSLLSGYKLNRINWLEKSSKSDWELRA